MKPFARLSVLLAIAPLGAILGSLSKNYTFSTSDIHIDTVEIEGRTYHEVFLEDCINDAADFGNPSLPVMDVHFILPPDERVDTIYITSLDSTTILTDAHPMPQQYPRVGPDSTPFVEESHSYYAWPSPGRAASVRNHGVSAEAHLVRIRLYPVQFDPSTQKLKLYTTIGISLHTEQCSWQTMIVYRDSLAKERKKERWESLVENPGDVSTYLEATWDKRALFFGEEDYEEKMAIITVPEFVPAFERLAEWKTQRGCSTGVYTIPEIGNGTYSPYYSAKILELIREKANAGCDYILLGGGAGIIPPRTCYYNYFGGGTAYTDFYYADCSWGEDDASDNIYKAWDESGNGVYGEPYTEYLPLLDGISFTDSDHGWVSGGAQSGEPYLLETSNGGEEWKFLTTIELGTANDIYFRSQTEGYMVGRFGIYRTIDGGENWQKVWPDETPIVLADIDFCGDHGWAVGKQGPIGESSPLVVRTTNGGADWEEVNNVPSSAHTSSLDAVSAARVWTTGYNSILRIDVDPETGDCTFTEEWQSSDTMCFFNLAFCDAERGCVLALDMYDTHEWRIYYRDEGEWKKAYTPSDFYDYGSSDMCALSTGKIFSFADRCYVSTNYGQSWVRDENLESVCPGSCIATLLKDNEDLLWVFGIEGSQNQTLKITNATEDDLEWNLYSQTIICGDSGVQEWEPDIAVGRLPVRTAEEAELLVDKILTYEKHPPEENYADRALFMADTMWGGEIPQAQDMADLWESKCGEAWELYQPTSGGDNELTRDNAFNALNAGYNYVYHIDHGNHSAIGAGSSKGWNPAHVLDAGDVAALTNGDKQSILITGSCSSANYYEHPYFGGCVAVEFLRNPNGGGVAYIGSVYPAENDNVKQVEKYFTEKLCNALDAQGIGCWYEDAILNKVTIYGAVNFHLLGDPSLQMWNGELQHFADAVGWEENGNQVTVTVYDNSSPPKRVGGATVCLYMKISPSGEGYYKVDQTTSILGRAVFTPPPPDGAILITVTKQNFVPHQEWKLKGNVSDTPIVVHYSHPTEHVNARNIAIDINGNLHLVYTDKEDGKKVAKYAFSVDTAKTWVIKEIDPNEEQETHRPAIALLNGINPYVAYFVGTNYCKVANLVTNNRIALDDREMNLIGGPGFVINNPKEGYVAMRSKSRLYYRKVGLGSDEFYVTHYEKDFPHDKLKDPQIYFEGSGPAIGVVSHEKLLGDKTAKPIIVADQREESGSKKLYYWFPEEPDGHDPEEFCEGRQPSISTDGAYVAVAYTRALKPRVRRANFYGPLEGSIPEEETPPQAEGSPPQTFHPNALVWPHGDIYLSVYDPAQEEWTPPYGFGTSTSYAPSADVSIPLDLGACAWSRVDGDNNYWLHVYAADLGDFPQSGQRKFPELIVTSPKAGDFWIAGSEWITWWQSKNSQGWTIDITYNRNPGWERIDDAGSQEHPRGDRYAGKNYYLWPVGKLKNGKMPCGYYDEEREMYVIGFDSCYIKVTCGDMTGISERFTVCHCIGRVIPPDDPPGGLQPPGTTHETEWGFISAYSCSQMNLLISTNNGQTFSTLSSGNLPSDSSVYDTIIYGVNNDTLVRMLYTGSIDWEVPNTPCSYNAGCLKLVGQDTTGDTASCVFGQFTIPIGECHVNSTAKNQRIIADGITSGSVGIAYTTKASDTSSSIVRYTETSDGLSLSEPDSLGIGILPAHSCGNVVWLSANQDSVFYSYWDPSSQTFPSGYLMGYVDQGMGGFGKFAPSGITSEGDTVYTAVLQRECYVYGSQPYTKYRVELRSFLKDNPQSFEADTISIPPKPGWDTTELSALSLEVLNGERHLAFAYKDTCRYFTDGSVIELSQGIAEGLLPTVAVYEGNVAYSYLSSDSTKLIRLWRYRDDIDITWVSADTITLTDTVECLTAAAGLLYGVQTRDSAKAQVCLYGPLSEAFYLQERLDGYYLHARHIPGDAEKWYLGFTQVDNSNYFLSTRVEDIRTLYPALYLKSALDRSPYTSYRDTCILIDDIYVDYGQDSLVYEFDRLSPATSYSVLLEFLCDADTTSDVAIEVNGQLDTLLLPAEGTMWYETDLSATSDLTVRLNRLGREPITLRRLVVRHSDPKGYAMGGPQGGPILDEIPFCLYQPFPNPFTNEATIRYSLPYATHVSLKIYDVSGRLVSKLVDGEIAPGIHELRWTGKDDVNRRCASGVYFVRFTTDQYKASKKMVLIK